MTDVSVFAGAIYDGPTKTPSHEQRAVPHYLTAYYWWAYVHPNAVKLFERQWLVNLILWGNYRRLCAVTLDELGEDLSGSTLQVCRLSGTFWNSAMSPCLPSRSTLISGAAP